MGIAEEVPQEQITREEWDDDAEIIRRKVVPVTTMSEMEAVDQMELLGHTFYLFRDLESGALCVLYRREADGYGLLQTAPEVKTNE